MPTSSDRDASLIERVARHERAFVLALGGYAVEVPGAHLVVHERLPAPALNFVQVVEVPTSRQAAFFERALDHYFQRAIRPTFRVPTPVPPHLDQGLRSFGFRRIDADHLVLIAEHVRSPEASGFQVRPAVPDQLGQIVELWGAPGSPEEFRRSLEVLWNFPHAEERVEPLIVTHDDGSPLSAALVYRNRGVTGVYAVTTRTDARGRGGATALVLAACDRPIARESDVTYLPTDHRRGSERMLGFGFRLLQRQAVYALDRDAELALPPVGPASPPRWRPPRARTA